METPSCCAPKQPKHKAILTVFKTYTPLIAVVAVTTSITLALLHSAEAKAHDAMTLWMGIGLCLFAVFKLASPQAFHASFRQYDPIAMRLPLYAVLYPYLELIIGLMFIAGIGLAFAAPLGFFILGVTGMGIMLALKRKEKLTCACLGGQNGLPLGLTSLIENGLMSAMCFFMMT